MIPISLQRGEKLYVVAAGRSTLEGKTTWRVPNIPTLYIQAGRLWEGGLEPPTSWAKSGHRRDDDPRRQDCQVGGDDDDDDDNDYDSKYSKKAQVPFVNYVACGSGDADMAAGNSSLRQGGVLSEPAETQEELARTVAKRCRTAAMRCKKQRLDPL